MMQRSFFLSVALLALEASAFWRLPCRQRLALERIDPIDTPGVVAKHVHTIHGGSAFAQAVTNADLMKSDCSSCSVKEDKSAYWTPNLYWENENKELIAVNQTGGMLVYYLQRGKDVKPFPEGFRVIAGDNRLRNFTAGEEAMRKTKSEWAGAGLSTDQQYLRQMAIGFNCLNYAAPAEAALGLQYIPQEKSCPDGLRAEVFFPSCWDGKNVDSEDHRSHMAYPTTVDDGECPEGFPIRLPSLFFETIWNVNAYAGQKGRFVFSNGDPTGYGYHGDFMNAWQQDVLERAVNNCLDPSGVVEKCGEFTFYTDEEYSQCTKKPEIEEDVWGPLKELPGCNAVWDGPEYAKEGGCSGDKDSDLSDKKMAGSASKPKNEDDEDSDSVESASGDKPELVPQAAEPNTAKAAEPSTAKAAEPSPAQADSNSDPYLVIVTVTSYVEGETSTRIAEEKKVIKTVYAEPKVVTVTAGAAAEHVKRHRAHLHKRHH